VSGLIGVIASYVLAVAYFLVDGLSSAFFLCGQADSKWLGASFRGKAAGLDQSLPPTRRWRVLDPVIALEPVKPVAAYMGGKRASFLALP